MIAYRGAQRSRPATADADPIEAALAKALEGATAAGRWDAGAQLARELEARRLEGHPNVVAIQPRRARKE
jgi:hypothetical protein